MKSGTSRKSGKSRKIQKSRKSKKSLKSRKSRTGRKSRKVGKVGKLGKVGKVGKLGENKKLKMFDFLLTFLGQSEFGTDCLGLVLVYLAKLRGHEALLDLVGPIIKVLLAILAVSTVLV